nr:uncharacterized mitochondrial protein AtMg00810-like [Tanacetum cinerariifolium]
KARCYNCLQLGHFARVCNVKKVDEKARYSAFKISEVKTDEPKVMSDFAYHAGNAAGSVYDAAAEFAVMGISPTVQTCPFECDSKLSELKKNYDHLENIYNDSFIQVQAYKNTVKTLELQRDWYHKTQLALEEKAKIEKKEWEVKLVESLSRAKLGLGFKEYIRSNEVFDLSTPSIFDPEPTIREVKSLYERFVKASEMHEVPPSITGTFMPTSYKSVLEETQITFGSKSTTSSINTFESNDFVSCDNNDKSSESETCDLASCVSSPKTTDSFSTVDVKILPKSDVKDPSPTNDFPSCSVKENVKPPRNLCNKSRIADRNHCKNNFVRTKTCFVCGSKSHLIKDCDVYDYVPSVVSKAASVPAGSRNSSASISAGRCIPAASGNRPASIHTGSRILAGRINMLTFFCWQICSYWDDEVHPHVNKDIGIVDNGCSQSITGNKEKLDDFVQVKGVLTKEFPLPDESQVVLRIPRRHDLYTFNLSDIQPVQQINYLLAKASLAESTKWHRRMTHVNFKTINKLAKKWSGCRSIDHKYYSLVVTDDFSQFSGAFFLGTKDETFYILKDFLALIENQLNKNVKAIRCDNGTEFQNAKLIDLYREKVIKRDYSNARTPQQNRVAERKNRTLIGVARSMLVDSKLPTMFWTEAVSTACYILNRVSITSPHNKTPYELLSGKVPNISHLKPFGCHVTILITSDHLGKFKGKASEGFLIGYAANSKAYGVYNLSSKKVKETLNLRYLEDKPNVQGLGQEWYFDLDYLTDLLGYTRFKTNTPAGTQDTNINAGPKVTEVSATIENHLDYADELARLQRQENEAHFAAERDLVLATRDSAGSLVSTGGIPTGSIAVGSIPTSSILAGRIPTGCVSAGSILLVVFLLVVFLLVVFLLVVFLLVVFLLVVAGSVISAGFGDPAASNSVPAVFNPDHADTSTLPLGHSLGSSKHSIRFPFPSDLGNHQPKADIFSSSSYDDDFCTDGTNLASSVDVDPVATKRPLRILIGLLPCKRRCNNSSINRVVKALYGLHQVPRAWYARLSTFLLKHHYRRGTIGNTLFIKKDSRHIILVQVYVDDIIFGSTNKAWCDEFEVLMKGEFEISAMGEMTFFLGLQVKQFPDSIFLSQDKYVKDMLKKFDMESVRTATTPYEVPKPKSQDESDDAVNVHLYRSMIGSFMYLTAFRPDIMFAVSACSRHPVTHLTSHLNDVKKIFKYLKGQPNLGLWYLRDSLFQLEAYSDSDYAGSYGDRKSTIGGCQFLGRRLISWQCKKQTIVATSTTEAKYASNVAGSIGVPVGVQVHAVGWVCAGSCTIPADSYYTILTASNWFMLMDWFLLLLVYAVGLVPANSYATPAGYVWTLLLLKISNTVWDNHNKVAYLEKGKGWEAYEQILDFLNRSHIRYALTHHPSVVFDSLVKQFWATTTVRTLEAGPSDIIATIDGTKVVVSESLIRTQLQLNDVNGLYEFTLHDVLDGMREIGPSTAAQETSVREPTPMREPTSSPMREPTPFHEPTPDSPIPPSPPPYSRSKEVGPTTSTRPPSLTRQTSFQADVSEGGGDFVSSPKSNEASQTPAVIAAGSTEDSAALTALSLKLDRCIDMVTSLENELDVTKKVLGGAVLKLVTRLKWLEGLLQQRKRRLVLSDSEGKEAASKEQDIDLDALHKLASTSLGGDSIEVPIDTTMPFSRTSTTRRRLRKTFTSLASDHFPENISAVEDTLPASKGIPAAATTIPVGLYIDPAVQAAAATPSSTIPSADKGKAPMVNDSLPADQFAIQQEELAQKAQAESVASPAKHLLGDDVTEDNMNEWLGILLMRKRRELAEQSWVKTMNKTQQRDYMRTFVKNQSALVYNQGWTMKQVPTSVSAAPSIATDVSVFAAPTFPVDVTKSPPHLSLLLHNLTLLLLRFLQRFDSASDSDDDPTPYAPYARWEMVPTPFDCIHAYYDMEELTKHFTSLRQLLHMVEKNDLRKLLGDVDNFYQSQEPETLGWHLYPRAHVYVLETMDGRVIYMFVDVSYPLSATTLERMLKHRLEVPKLLVGGDLTMAEQLVCFIKAELLNAPSAI